MSLVDVRNLSFTYENSSEEIFSNVSFHFDTDWKLGLVGRNGRGKTTFLRLLSGDLPSNGAIVSSTAFQYFPPKISGPEKEITEVLMAEAFPDRNDWEILREMDRMKMDSALFYQPWQTLSFGEKTQLLLSCLFAGGSDFLLIDEPTSHLDSESRDRIRAYLQRKKSFLLVSHDRETLDLCTDHTISLNRTSIELCQGSFRVFMENKTRREKEELSQNIALEKEIRQLTTAIRQTRMRADSIERKKIGFDPTKENDRSISTRAFLAAKSKRLQSSRKNMELRQRREIEEKKRLLRDLEIQEDLKLYPKVYPGSVLIRAKELTLHYTDQALFLPVTFEIHTGDRIHLSGKNGSGKSSLIKALLGEFDKDRMQGDLWKASSLEISVLTQDVSHLSGVPAELAQKSGIDPSLYLALLRKLDLPREAFSRDIRDYSEGQRKKAAIALSLAKPAHLYIWDEPLNYVDIFSRMQLEELILKYKPTMLFVEHDSVFAEKTASKTLTLIRESDS